MTALTTETPTDEAIDAPAPAAGGCPFTIPVMVLEGYQTSDDRLIRPGALAHRALPASFMVMDEAAHGGVPGGATVGGHIATMERYDASALTDPVTGQPYGAGVFAWRASGFFDNDDEGWAFARKAASKSLRGVSVDLAVTEYEETVLEEDDDGWPTRVLFEVVAGEVMGATLCPFPAFAGAYIVVDPTDAGLSETPEAEASAEGEAVAASASGPPWLRITEAEECGTCPDGTLVAAGTIPDDAPPADWFTDPGLDGPTPLTVTADGRVYGHLAAWGTCHTGMPGRCVTAPRSPDGSYAHFTVGAVMCADGSVVPAGALTVAANHADLRDSALAAIDHYANTGQCAALVAAGEDSYGIWVAGYVPPGTPGPMVAALRGHPLSGDWRPVGGQLRLVGALAVNTPGFTVPRARVASGRPMALVAAGSAAVVAAAAPPVEKAPAWAVALGDQLAELRRDRDADRALARLGRRRR